MKKHVLLSVEDDETDFYLIRLALKDLDIPHELYRVKDGEEGLRFLKQVDSYQDAPRPDLILTNVNMPKKTGLEMLADIKADASLSSIPVVVLTSGQAQREKKKALELGAHDYITKPSSLGEFVEAIKASCLRILARGKTAGVADPC